MYKFNIDRLKLCLVSNEIDMYERIQTECNNNSCYFLELTHKNENEIMYDVYPQGIEVKLGSLLVNKGENGCISTFHFFEFSNEALYTNFTCNGNLICLVDYIFDDLGFRVNNITRIEIALDTTINAITKIDNLIKDRNITMLFNNKIIKDMDKKIQNAFYTYGRSRSRRDRLPSLFFKGIHNQVKIYDKAKEIAENSAKEYIRTWNNFKSKKIYRLEVRLDRRGWLDAISEIDSYVPYVAENWLSFILNYLPKIWEISFSRVLRFKDKKQEISIVGML